MKWNSPTEFTSGNSPAASGEEQFHNSPVVGQWRATKYSLTNPNKKYVCKAVRSRERPRKCQTENFTVFRNPKMGGTSVVDAEEWRERNFRDFAELEWSFPSLQNAYPGSLPFFLLFFSTKVYKTSLNERCVVLL